MAINYSVKVEDALWLECFGTTFPGGSDEGMMKKFNKWLKRIYHAEVVWRHDFDIVLEFTHSKHETFFGLKYA